MNSETKISTVQPGSSLGRNWGRMLFGLLLLLPLAVSAQSLSSRIDALIGEMLPKGGEVGIAVYDLTAGRSLYTHRAGKLCRPASTMKLLTAITSLARPDGEEPFRTEVWYDGTIVGDTLRGDLYVVGGFDPEFDDEAMDSLVARVAALPFSVLEGQVYGDVSMKDSLYWGNGWAWDDNPEAYQPYLSPLMFCKGTVELTAEPAAQGEPATVSCLPVSSYYTVVNRTQSRTPAAGKFILTRDWLTNGNQLMVQGNVDGVRKGWLNIYDSSRYFMHTFLERLRMQGLTVPDTYAFRPLPTDSAAVGLQPVAAWETPMQDVLDQLMKESDNLNAEALLCRLGARATGQKHISAREGLDEIKKLIRRLEYDPKNFQIADGCGLSNYNYLSPALLVSFLRFAYSNESVFRPLYQSLPVAGIDGTLQHRMKQSAAYRRVHAKTGSFTAINTLAGYLKTKNGHDIAFAIMNQNILSAAKARAFQDKVCALLCESVVPSAK